MDPGTQKEQCDMWVEEALRWLREERKRRSFAEARSRLRQRGSDDPSVDEELRKALELARKP